VDANRGTVPANEPRRLTSSAYDAQSSLSADGRRLAFVSTRSGNQDIWLEDMESGKEMAMTVTAAGLTPLRAHFLAGVTLSGNDAFGSIHFPDNGG
jgi:Tol biopolymer transport system component